LFADDFETGGCPCWRPVQGSWAVVLDSGTNHGYRNTNTSGSDWSYAGDTTWTDYAVQAQVKLITWASSGGIARVFARYQPGTWGDRKSTRLNSSHVAISYAVFCLKK